MKNMKIKKFTKNLVYVFLIFLLVSAVFSLLYQPLENLKEIPLSQVVADINQEKIKKITVSGDNVFILYHDESKAHSRKETETGLSQSLLNLEVNREKLAKVEIETKRESNIGAWVANILWFLLPLLIFFIFFSYIFKQARTGVTQAFDFTRARARLFGAEGHTKEKITFKDVAGLKEAKEELKEVVDFLKNPKKFLQMGAKIPRGVLLLGPSGVGKTLLARAVAGEANVPFFHTSGSSFVELFVGVGASRVRDLFATAKKAAPAILFIDELDAVGRMRGAGIGGGHDEREQTLNQILVEMDGFERDTSVIVLAATNRGDILDPALLRPGRFDRRIVLDLPDVNDREEILKIHCQGKPLALNVNLREIAERTPGFSGADLANLVNEAAILAARQNKTQIFQEELLESIEKVLLGPERRSYVLSKKEKEIAAYHESGHALVAASLPSAEPVRKVSIISRGMAAGYTLKVPTEDRKMKTKTEFLADIAIALGGYCAEKIKFKELTTGAANDLEQASQLARKLVKEYGMSALGPISFSDRAELIFLGREIGEQRNYSEKVAAQIDKEVEKFIKSAEIQATRILTNKRQMLDKIAKTLIEKETIEREEFEQLVKPAEIKKPKSAKKSVKVKIRRV
jgi:cell division protease FtsH